MDQKIIDLYDEYTHAPLRRRVFMERLIAMVGTPAAAAAVLSVLGPNYARAAVVAPDDARLTTEKVQFPGAGGPMGGYLVRAKAATGKLPAVLVIHENRGLNPHIEDVTRRMALEGFLALGVDALMPDGGTPSDPEKAREMFAKLDANKTVAHFVAAVAWLKNHAGSTGKVGIVGFCWGGGMVNSVATKSADVAAAVAYYGAPPPAADIANIKAPMLLHYAGLDTRLNERVPAFEEALKAAKVRYTLHTYEGANHAFNNDTDPTRYHTTAAPLAWTRTLAFFKQELKS